MPRLITIDPGKSKCGLVLAEISEKKVYEAKTKPHLLFPGSIVITLGIYDAIFKILISTTMGSTVLLSLKETTSNLNLIS